MPRPGKTPSHVSVPELACALPRHVMGCLLAGQPAVPPDATTAQLTGADIASSSHFDHCGKALTLLTSLCELSYHHRGLWQAILGRPDFDAQLVDAANLALLAVAGPEADACVGAAAAQASVQDALDRAAMVPAALRALAFAFTITPGGTGAAAAAAGGVLDWQAICEALLSVRGCRVWGQGQGDAWLSACPRRHPPNGARLPELGCPPRCPAAPAWRDAAGGRV